MRHRSIIRLYIHTHIPLFPTPTSSCVLTLCGLTLFFFSFLSLVLRRRHHFSKRKRKNGITCINILGMAKQVRLSGINGLIVKKKATHLSLTQVTFCDPRRSIADDDTTVWFVPTAQKKKCFYKENEDFAAPVCVYRTHTKNDCHKK